MKKIVCCISCAAIIGISVFYAGRLLQPNFTVDAFHAIESFHSMPENSFDVIACGSSHVYKGLNVNEMTERYGSVLIIMAVTGNFLIPPLCSLRTA